MDTSGIISRRRIKKFPLSVDSDTQVYDSGDEAINSTQCPLVVGPKESIHQNIYWTIMTAMF